MCKDHYPLLKKKKKKHFHVYLQVNILAITISKFTGAEVKSIEPILDWMNSKFMLLA